MGYTLMWNKDNLYQRIFQGRWCYIYRWFEIENDPKRGSLQAEWSIPKLSTDKRNKTRRESTGTWDPELAAAVAVQKHYLMTHHLQRKGLLK